MNKSDSSMQRDTTIAPKDTRRLTVAEEHLRNALEEVETALRSGEQSMQVAACQRAIRHLDLVLNRLGDEAGRADRQQREQKVDQALSQSRRAWQAIRDALNDWDYTSTRALPEARESLISALEANQAAIEIGMREESLMR